MLLTESADKLDRLDPTPRRLKPRKEELLLEALVVVLDELSDDAGALLERLERYRSCAFETTRRLLLDE